MSVSSMLLKRLLLGLVLCSSLAAQAQRHYTWQFGPEIGLGITSAIPLQAQSKRYYPGQDWKLGLYVRRQVAPRWALQCSPTWALQLLKTSPSASLFNGNSPGWWALCFPMVGIYRLSSNTELGIGATCNFLLLQNSIAYPSVQVGARMQLGWQWLPQWRLSVYGECAVTPTPIDWFFKEEQYLVAIAGVSLAYSIPLKQKILFANISVPLKL